MTTYYVSNDPKIASDDNPGTVEAPWLTLARALSDLKKGDSVIGNGFIMTQDADPPSRRD